VTLSVVVPVREGADLVGAAVRSLSPLKFAQEVTRRYNAATRDNAPIPASCEEFVRYGIEKNFATPLEEGS